MVHLQGHEIAFIIANHSTMYIRQMASALARDPDTVSRYLREHNLKAKKQHNSKTKAKAQGEIVTFRRNGSSLFYIKLGTKFKMLHHHIWEEMYGVIPPGYVVSFKDHDSLNVDPSNLVLVSRKKWLARNSINNYPKDIRELIRLSSQLKKSLHEQSKNSTTSAVQRTDGTQRSGDQIQSRVP